MRRLTRRRSLGSMLAALATTALLLAHPAASQQEPSQQAAAQSEATPEPGSWDQQAVTRTSQQLQRALEALLSDPDLDATQATAFQQREHTAAIASAREIAGINAELARRLAAGYDRDETQAFWDRIAAARGDIQAYARHSWLPAGTQKRAERAGNLMDELAVFYESVE